MGMALESNRIAKKLAFKGRWQLAAHPGHIKRVAAETSFELVDKTIRSNSGLKPAGLKTLNFKDDNCFIANTFLLARNPYSLRMKPLIRIFSLVLAGLWSAVLPANAQINVTRSTTIFPGTAFTSIHR
jgi:hypothetical protein